MEIEDEFQIRGKAYIVNKFIGQGGMSRVYVAYSKGEEKRDYIAVKVLPQEMVNDRRKLNALKEEFSIIRKLKDHKLPNLIDIREFIKIKGEYCLIMPYMAGKNLKQRIIDKERINKEKVSLSEKARITKEIAQGLAFLHAYNIIHGDVKPQNVLFDEKGNLVISDFGLSHSLSPSFAEVVSKLLIVGLLKKRRGRGGTPAYMSPQQLQGKRSLKSDDVYGFGILAYELFTKSLPFTLEMASRERKVIYREHYLARKLDSNLNKVKNKITHLPSDLQNIILNCLSFKRSERFLDMGTVYVRLENLGQKLINSF